MLWLNCPKDDPGRDQQDEKKLRGEPKGDGKGKAKGDGKGKGDSKGKGKGPPPGLPRERREAECRAAEALQWTCPRAIQGGVQGVLGGV